MTVSNDVLTAVALVEKIVPMLKSDRRDQITRTSVEAVKRMLGQALNKIVEIEDVNFSNVNMYLAGAYKLTEEILQDDRFDMTDSETKKLLVGNIEKGLESLYLATGKYYRRGQGHEFDYSFGLDALLRRIIDNCIAQGFYFGM